MRARHPHLCLGALLWASAARAETSEGARSVDQPWDESVRLEQAGDLQGAEAVLIAAWGKKPDNYYAQLRLAYLALLDKRANAAVARYRRARRFPEAEGDTDVVAGYAAALALRGWQLAALGQPSQARRYWQRALTVKSDEPDALAGLASVTAPMTAPEAWAAVVGESFGSGRYQGWAAFGQLPWRFFDRLTLRAAGRHIDWRQVSPVTPWAFPGQAAARWTVNEIYGGAGYDTPTVTAEGLAFAIAAAGSSTISGAGVRLRVGRAFGALAELAALGADGHWASEQLRPVGFLEIGYGWVLHAGARFTRDAGNNWASGLASAFWARGPFAAYAEGHLGTEHWAADLASPSVLSIAPRTRAGGAATVLWDATRMLRMALQGEACALAADGATGTFWSVALGLQVRISNP